MVEDYEEMCRQVQDFFDLRRKPVAVRLLKEPVAPDARKHRDPHRARACRARA